MVAVKYWFRIASSVLLACSVGNVYSADAADFEELLGGLAQVSAKFTQIDLDARGAQGEELSGRMWLAKPGRFRWEITHPYNQVIVTDGEQIFVHDADLDQVTVRPLAEALEQTPISVLSGDFDDIDQQFHIFRAQPAADDTSDTSDTSDTADKQANAQTFILRPKEDNGLFKSLSFTFQARVLKQLGIEDQFGKNVFIEFTEVAELEVVESATFQFEIPPGADVIGDVRQPG